MLTNVIGREVIQGCSDKGIINGPKHMGFNDQEHNRAGISAYMTEQKFRETDLRGFEGALSDAFGMGVMIAFNRIGATNASHHVGMIQKIVRGDLTNIAERVKEAGITKTALTVVGDFLGNDYDLSKLYDKTFTTEFRKGVTE